MRKQKYNLNKEHIKKAKINHNMVKCVDECFNNKEY